jgi:hypothetical protein
MMLVRRAVESSTSSGGDMDFTIRAANTLQALACLNHLIGAKADDPSKVHEYAILAQEKLQTLGELMRPMLWRPTFEAPFGGTQTDAPRSLTQDAMTMLDSVRILTAEPDHDDGLIVTFSDGTTAGYVTEELVEMRPFREQTAEATSGQLLN